MTLPRMLPVKFSFIRARMAFGSIQLLVGPASISSSEQIKVFSSTLATSLGSVRDRKLSGRSFGFSGISEPLATSNFFMFVSSSAEPSHHFMESGLVRDAIWSTQSLTLVTTTQSSLTSSPSL